MDLPEIKASDKPLAHYPSTAPTFDIRDHQHPRFDKAITEKDPFYDCAVYIRTCQSSSPKDQTTPDIPIIYLHLCISGSLDLDLWIWVSGALYLWISGSGPVDLGLWSSGSLGLDLWSSRSGSGSLKLWISGSRSLEL